MLLCGKNQYNIRSFPGGSDGKESSGNAGDLSLTPGSGRFPGVGMATHSSILVWRIPWTVLSMGLQQRVRRDFHKKNFYSYLSFKHINTFLIFLILKSLILTCVPKHEPPSHHPPHNISVGHPHAPAPSMLYPASDIDWRFNSYMIVYMLESHF